ncbi:MAG TPA: hypothetical protein VFE62_26985 [Gemmataceae bacterium]|nr:hypothetical protein [Gemmataceae bacterium]
MEDDLAGEVVTCPWCDQSFTAAEPPERLLSLASLVESLLSETKPAVDGTAGESAVATPPDTSVPHRSRRRFAGSKKSKRSFKLWFRLAAGCLVVAGAGVVLSTLARYLEDSAEAPTSANYVEWRADPFLVTELGDWKNFDHFKFRPPKSMSLLSVLPDPGWLPREGHFTGLRFQGSQGDRAELYCTVVTFPEAAPLTGGLEQGLDRFYDWLGYRAAVVDLSRGKPELGLLNGQNCLRAAFACGVRKRRTVRGDKREGVVYVLLDGGRQVTFYGLCDPALRDEFDLIGASLLTWQEQ